MEAHKDINFFGKTNYRNKEVPFGIRTDDRRRHMYVIGKTGMGKTTFMENMVIQDIHNGHGVCFIDPHGDSVANILNYIPSSRINDVVYFNPADLEFPIAFNILEAVEAKYKHLVASGLMGVFTKIWANMWSARMEYILNNTILALLESPGNTMLGIVRMYVDKKYRKKIVDNVKDPMVRAFWVDEFANYAEKYRTEAVAPIQNKVGQFLSSGIIRNIVGQPRSTIDLRQIMDDRKILLLDLSKGKVGEDNSALLGAMIITKLQLAALSRVDIPETERKDFYLYVDEFQNFVTESFATILSEARKYRLNLTVAHQYIGQLTPDKNSTKVRDAVFGNVGTMVAFRVGAADAEYLETEFAPVFLPADLVNLPKYNIILKLMINGVSSDPFSAATMPVDQSFYTGNADKVIKVSRERHGNDYKDVEEKISRWMGVEFHEQTAALVVGKDREAEEGVAGDRFGEAGPPQRQFDVPRESGQNFRQQEASAMPAASSAPVKPKMMIASSAIKQSSTPASAPAARQVTGPAPERRAAPANFQQRPHQMQPRPQNFQSSQPRRPFTNPANPVKKNKPAGKPENSIWDQAHSLQGEKVKRLEQEFDAVMEGNDDVSAPALTVKPGEKHTF